MCFNASIVKERDYLEKRFGARFEEPERYRPLYQAAARSSPSLPIITGDKPGAIQLVQWGLIPRWARDEKQALEIRKATYNARAETLREKPSFRQSARDRRCLVLVDGFYEWHEADGRKFPHYIHRSDREAFALAGLWDGWTDPATRQESRTFTIITTPANKLLAEIHNTKKRMPAILPREDEKAWLASDLTREGMASLLRPCAGGDLQAHTVSKTYLLDKGFEGDPRAIERFEYPELRSRQARLF